MLEIDATGEKSEFDEAAAIKESKKSLDLFKVIIPSIFLTKKDELKDEILHKKYPPFIITRAISQYIDCLDAAQKLNLRPNIPPRPHYIFLLNTIRKGRRQYVPWAKKPETELAIDIVAQYSKVSRKKAEQMVKILSLAQIEYMRRILDPGE